MSTELLIGVISSGAGLVGVALGIVGALFGARMQAQGSHAQAEATQQAAATTAVTQYAATLVQQNRAAQRTAYVSFLSAARDFQRRVGYVMNIPGDSDESAHDMREQMVHVEAAFAAVQLEGPDRVLTQARRVEDSAHQFYRLLANHGDTYRAWNRFYAHYRSETPREFAAVASLENLQEITRELSERDRILLISAADVLAVAAGMGERGSRWSAEYQRARCLLEAFVTERVLTEREADRLVYEAGTSKCSVGDLLITLSERLDDGIASFIEAARTHLSATVPELG
ncbi:hypothetical protein [Streptomyces sp. NPDC091259]|uniref:hypothetical protein n=1 Tax=Streptomyces sp. NPDC091259 TaxID=3365976 RepID=UPI0038171A98